MNRPDPTPCPANWTLFSDWLIRAVELTHTYTVLDSAKTNDVTWRGREFSHCPFCGVELNSRERDIRDRHPAVDTSPSPSAR